MPASRIRPSIVPAIVFLACGMSHAETPAKKPAVSVQKAVSSTGMNRLSHTCSDMQRADIVATQNGGWLEYPNGSFVKAEVQQGSAPSAAAVCYYGVNYSSGMAQVYLVRFEMKGFKGNECTVSGKTVNCSR